jgi:hypothetical protein
MPLLLLMRRHERQRAAVPDVAMAKEQPVAE